MKNRYSLFKKGYWEAGVLLGLCLLIASCGEKEFTTDMPENKLITAISLKVSSELPVQLGTDTTIVLSYYSRKCGSYRVEVDDY